MNNTEMGGYTAKRKNAKRTGQVKDHQVNVNFTEREHSKLHAAACQLGISISALARGIILGDFVVRRRKAGEPCDTIPSDGNTAKDGEA